MTRSGVWIKRKIESHFYIDVKDQLIFFFFTHFPIFFEELFANNQCNNCQKNENDSFVHYLFERQKIHYQYWQGICTFYDFVYKPSFFAN
jgi:hypothetical protein